MNFTVKEYLTFSAVFAALSSAVFGQYGPKGQETQYNDISNNDDDKHVYQPYGFGYDIEDGYGNKQWRHEKSQEASNVIGSYGFKDRDGIMREVEYVADKNGFRARIKTNEPGTAPKDPGDVKFEAQPVIVSIKHEESPKGSGSGQDYEPNSSRVHRVQHRIGRIPIRKSSRMGWAASRPFYTYVPYYHNV